MAPSERGWEEIRIGIALTVLTFIAVVLRFVARFTKKVKLGIDDWLALVSMVSIVAMSTEMILWATIWNSGKHFSTLTAPDIKQFFKIFLLNEFTYGVASPLVKLTILFFYRRLFKMTNFCYIANLYSVLCVLWGAVTILVVGIQCRPLARYWDPDIPGTCISKIAFVEGIQAFNIFLDISILIMPLPIIWRLHRPWQDKLALSGVFLLGGFIVSASIYRLIVLTQIKTDDLTYTTYDGIVWTFVEPCIGLVCACLPTIGGLLPSFARKVTTAGYSNQSEYGRWQRPCSGDQSLSDTFHNIETSHQLLKSAKLVAHSSNMSSCHIRVDTSIEMV